MQIVERFDADMVVDRNQEFRKTLEYLHIIKQRYNTLYDDSPDLCRTVNTDGIIINCNKAYAKNFGFLKKEIIGTSIFDSVSDESIDDMYSSFKMWKTFGKVKNYLIWFKKRDNTTFPGLISANNLYDVNEKLIGSNTIIRDVSEIFNTKKQIIELKTKDTQKEKFASMVTHDLKALVHPVLGYCKLLKKQNALGSLNAEQLDAVNEIFANSKKLEKLVSDIHDVQKIELNQINISKRIIRVDKMLDMIRGICNVYEIEKKIKIRINLPKETFLIFADVDRTFQIFLNLIRNAIDFVSKNDGIIEIGIIPEKKFIVFYVCDNGIGIAAEKQEKLFHEFYQAETVSQEIHSGSGLGLAICKGLVKKMGGRIWVESIVGKGSTIFFSLPRGNCT